MDPEINQKLCQFIKQITETGEWFLDEQKLKSIKLICKRSDQYVAVAFENVMAQLNKKHAQIRYSSLQLIEQLFERSKLFRELLTEDFPEFIQLSVGIHNEKLPPPQIVAVKLKQYALTLIKNWHLKHGEKYQQIGISFDILLESGLIVKNLSDFNISAHITTKETKSERIKAIKLNKYEVLKADLDDYFVIINNNLDIMDGCFDILVPKNNPEKGRDIDLEALLKGDYIPRQNTESNYKQDLISHGLGSNRYKITIDLSEKYLMDDIKETQENSIVFEQLREVFTVMETKHIKQINDWISSLIKLDVSNRIEKQTCIKKLIDLKSRITEASKKAQMLGIQVSYRKKSTGPEEIEDEFENEEFEEIDINEEVKTKRKNNNEKTPPLQRIFPLSNDPHIADDPTYIAPRTTIDKITTKDKGKNKVDTSRDELLKVAPFVEWGDDLYYWDKEHIQFNTSGIERSHRFMAVGEGTSQLPSHLLDDLRKRPMFYKQQTPEKINACRNPLHSGGLCPRRDLVTCPFHGKIVPRDDLGRPFYDSSTINEGFSKHLNNENPLKDTTFNRKEQNMENLWEILESDVMNQTGQERIIMNKKEKKRIQSEKSSLIDVKKKPENSYIRLQQKINSLKKIKLMENAANYEQEMKSHNKFIN